MPLEEQTAQNTETKGQIRGSGGKEIPEEAAQFSRFRSLRKGFSERTVPIRKALNSLFASHPTLLAQEQRELMQTDFALQQETLRAHRVLKAGLPGRTRLSRPETQLDTPQNNSYRDFNIADNTDQTVPDTVIAEDEQQDKLEEKKRALHSWVESIDNRYIQDSLEWTIDSKQDSMAALMTDQGLVSTGLLLRLLNENSGNYQLFALTETMVQGSLRESFSADERAFWDSWLQLDEYFKMHLLRVVGHTKDLSDYSRLSAMASVCTEMKNFKHQPALWQISVDPFLYDQYPHEALRTTTGIITSEQVPDVIKIFTLFQNRFYPTYDSETGVFAQEKLKMHPQTLLRVPEDEAYPIIYSDLLRLHVESDNFSLRHFLTTALANQSLLDKTKAVGFDQLSEKERMELTNYCRQAEMLQQLPFISSTRQKEGQLSDGMKLEDRVAALEKSLSLSDNEKITDRLATIFAHPIGLTSLEGVLARMDEARAEASELHNGPSNSANDRLLPLKRGDILKTIDINHLAGIIAEGAVSGEFIPGVTQDKKANPFSSDVIRVLPEDENGTFLQAFSAFFGDDEKPVIILIRDRGQFDETSSPDKANTRSNGQAGEIFHAGEQTRHYAIRTGFAPTQIDAIILGKADVRENVFGANKEYARLLFGLTGLDTPIADKDGAVLVNAEDYRQDNEAISQAVTLFQSESPRPHDLVDALKQLPFLKSLYEKREEGRGSTQTVQSSAEAALDYFESHSASDFSPSVLSKATARLVLSLLPLQDTRAFYVRGHREAKDMFAKAVLPLILQRFQIPLEQIQIVTKLAEHGFLDDSKIEKKRDEMDNLAASLAVPAVELTKLVQMLNPISRTEPALV